MSLFAEPSQRKPAENAPAKRGTLHPAGFYLLVLPICLVVLALLWWRFGPIHPGTALAGAVLAIAVLLLRADRSPPREKAVWCALALAFLCAELCTAIMAHSLANSLLVGRVLDNHLLQIKSIGSSRIRDTKMFVVDLDRISQMEAAHITDDAAYGAVVQFLPLADFSPGQQITVPIHISPQGPIAHYRLSFFSDQTSWWEDLQTRNVGGHLVEAYRLRGFRNTQPRELFEHQDPGFSSAAAPLPDWSWARQVP